MDERPERGDDPIDDPHAATMSLLREFWPGARDLNHDDDIFDALGIYGDDAFDLMEAYSARFGVEVSDYRWYFHHGEEGSNPGALFFHPPYARVKRIPITLDVLAEGIERKHWPLQYPDHQLPKVRWDVWLQLPATLLILVLGLLVTLIAMEFLHRNFD
jgi:hypothetical protein